ncbi:polyprenyl synthetase family protein [Paucidesulfovibrio longus]|uniref:polyprenyl synthetase family protein n=1 Tax=Paucidesulfovibrio longus TaxID=889 RepID=UPI0003B5BFD8|nr:farnesyl diphosphate synthase [Paucidesulfovibrio longus]
MSKQNGIKDKLAARAREVDGFLCGCLEGRGFPARLRESMEYSLMAGGKRLRPVLLLSFVRLLGGDADAALPFAASLEMIHTYSLIHDDLPAMDDDDLRRGRPSNHKRFDEATAILAGDGLLTESFGFMLDAALERGLPSTVVLQAMRMMVRSAGCEGMVGGQALDMQMTGGKDTGLDELRAMHAMKTGALLTASCACGAILAGAPLEDLRRATAYGKEIGVAFQIVDDVLDVVGDEASLGKPVGSDEANGKITYPSLVGLDRSRAMAGDHIAEALRQLEPYAGPEREFLEELARYIVERVQ